MNDYAMGAIVEPTRARIRIQIKSTPEERVRGNRDKILIVTSYTLTPLGDGTFVLNYRDRDGLRQHLNLRSGQYIETKLMG
jgi:hypothetical protein